MDALDHAGGKREWLDDRDSRSSWHLLSPSHRCPMQSRSDETEGKAHSATRRPSPVSAEELAAFMVDFVIEQTGYPRDIIDLDADFEADLGLDSIKMTQLFGELREHFGFAIQAEDRGLLAQCRSLRAIGELLLGESFSREPPSNAEVSKNATDGQWTQVITPEKGMEDKARAFAKGKEYAQHIRGRLFEESDRAYEPSELTTCATEVLGQPFETLKSMAEGHRFTSRI